MDAYREVWGFTVGVLGAVGVSLALLLVPGDVLVFLTLVLLMFVAAVAWAFTEGRGGRQAAWLGLLTLGALLAAIGYLSLLGPAGMVPVSAAILSAPSVVRALSRRRRGLPADDWPLVPRSEASRAEVSAAAAWSAEQTVSRQDWMDASSRDMEPTALCRAWRESGLALQQPVSASCKGWIVQRRRELLDELERRNPAGFTAWLASGAMAAEDPRRYIVTRGDESHR